MRFWFLVTRLGEAQLLLPAAALAVWVLLQHAPGRRLAAWWMGLLAAAAALTTASKVAFIGWGWGVPQLDFTGVSGHAMFAAAVYPVLLLALLAPRRRALALGGGAALALLVGVSRVLLHAHSVSEVLSGLVLGAAVPVLALRQVHAGPAPAIAPQRAGAWVLAGAGLWLAVAPLAAPDSRSHQLVTRLALALAGHEQPYRRGPWLREWRARLQSAAPGAASALACSSAVVTGPLPLKRSSAR